MPLDTLVIKERVERYKELIKNKEEVEKQFATWKEFYENLKKETEEAREIYESQKNLNSSAANEAKEEVDSWLKQEKDCLDIIDELTSKFDEINTELNAYDEKTIESEVEYIANVIRFDEISKKMKEIEKRSKKIAGGATIGTNLVKVENAEGRMKDINEMFAEDYYKLALEKRAIAKAMMQQSRSLEKLVSRKEEVVVDEKEDVVESEVVESIQNEEKTATVVTDNSSLYYNLNDRENPYKYDREKFKTLTLEEKIAFLKLHRENLRNAHGKKIYPTYKGEKIEIAEKYYGDFRQTDYDLSKFEEELEKELMNKKLKEANLSVDLNIEDTIAKSLHEDNTKSLAEKLIEEYSTGVADLTEENLKTEYTDEQYDMDNDELITMVNKHAEESNVETEKDKKFNIHNLFKKTNDEEKVETIEAELVEETEKDEFENIYSKSKDIPANVVKVKNIRKPKDKEKLKYKLKKALMIIAACAVIAVTTMPIVSTIIDKINNGKATDDDLDNLTSSMSDSADEDVQNRYQDYEEPVENQDEEIAEEIQESTSIKLGDTFEVKEGALIHNNMYDATLSRDGASPYFGYESTRMVGGMAINYEGELYFFYHTNENAQENIDKLLANGGKVTAILGANENGYEGFYNANDVLMLNQTLGGTSR